jgi:hypothetical protein
VIDHLTIKGFKSFENVELNLGVLNFFIGMLAQCGKPNARVLVLTNPKVQGYEHARQKLPEIVERYRHFDLILFLVDADGKDKATVFQALESNAASNGSALFCAAAEQEVEVWLLAGQVRRDISVKENVFEPFLSKYGDRRRYGGGRDLLMREANGVRSFRDCRVGSYSFCT